MGRIGLAFRLFFAALSGSLTPDQVRPLLAGEGAATPLEPNVGVKPSRPTTPSRPSSGRDSAISLLAALQREARLVDLIQEPLNEYSDEQIGAAARDVLRDCQAALSRMMDIQPVLAGEEGAEVETPNEFRAARIRIVGQTEGEPPYRGRLVHPGWLATRCELPRWTGSDDDARVIAPAEIEC